MHTQLFSLCDAVGNSRCARSRLCKQKNLAVKVFAVLVSKQAEATLYSTHTLTQKYGSKHTEEEEP